MKSGRSYPLARSDRLVIENVGDETVIYDLDTSVAHALKPLAASVFTYADGTNGAAEIAELAAYRLGTPVTEADVSAALEQLDSLALLDTPETSGGLSRRDALKAFAVAGAGTMLITSVAAPIALAASPYSCPEENSGICPAGNQGGSSATSSNHGGCAEAGTNPVEWVQPGTSLNPSTGWDDGVPTGLGSSCTYYSGGETGGKLNTATGEWQCVPCDSQYGYHCCSIVCAPAGTGDAWGTGHAFSTACYLSSGFYGKYCYSCPGNQD